MLLNIAEANAMPWLRIGHRDRNESRRRSYILTEISVLFPGQRAEARRDAQMSTIFRRGGLRLPGQVLLLQVGGALCISLSLKATRASRIRRSNRSGRRCEVWRTTNN